MCSFRCIVNQNTIILFTVARDQRECIPTCQLLDLTEMMVELTHTHGKRMNAGRAVLLAVTARLEVQNDVTVRDQKSWMRWKRRLVKRAILTRKGKNIFYIGGRRTCQFAFFAVVRLMEFTFKENEKGFSIPDAVLPHHNHSPSRRLYLLSPHIVSAEKFMTKYGEREKVYNNAVVDTWRLKNRVLAALQYQMDTSVERVQQPLSEDD